MIVPRGSTAGLFLASPRTRKRRGLGWRPEWSLGRWYGLGSISPVGFADFASYQNAVTASYPACPPPYDPSCTGPRSAAISADLNAWTSNSLSCHNVVCDQSGSPAISVQQYTTPSGTSAIGTGYNTVAGFVPTVTTPAPVSASQSSSFTLTAPVTAPSKPVTPPSYVRRPVPIQSASAAAAPGGVLAPAAAPQPVQTQTPPVTDGTTPATAISVGCDPGIDPLCGATLPSPTDFGSIISSIPLWGWALGVGALILITRPGGKR